MYKLFFTKQYILDLSITIDYICSVLKDVNAAIKLRNKIDEKLKAVEMFPEGFAIFETNGKTEKIYRRLIVNKYIVLYYIENNKVVLSRFINAKMDCNKLVLEK